MISKIFKIWSDEFPNKFNEKILKNVKEPKNNILPNCTLSLEIKIIINDMLVFIKGRV